MIKTCGHGVGSMTVTEATKRDKILFILFLIGVVVLALIIVYLMEIYEVSMLFFMAATHTAVVVGIICLFIFLRVPIAPGKTGTVYSECFEEPVPVMLSISANVVSRKPFEILVDGKKVAVTYRGRELQVLMPKGKHEVSVRLHKDIEGNRIIEIHDELELFIWQSRTAPLPYQIELISGDKAALEEAARRSRRSGNLVALSLLVFFAIVSVILWAVIIF